MRNVNLHINHGELSGTAQRGRLVGAFGSLCMRRERHKTSSDLDDKRGRVCEVLVHAVQLLRFDSAIRRSALVVLENPAQDVRVYFEEGPNVQRSSDNRV
jgi:hypothetical protein